MAQALLALGSLSTDSWTRGLGTNQCNIICQEPLPAGPSLLLIYLAWTLAEGRQTLIPSGQPQPEPRCLRTRSWANLSLEFIMQTKENLPKSVLSQVSACAHSGLRLPQIEDSGHLTDKASQQREVDTVWME